MRQFVSRTEPGAGAAAGPADTTGSSSLCASGSQVQRGRRRAIGWFSVPGQFRATKVRAWDPDRLAVAGQLGIPDQADGDDNQLDTLRRSPDSRPDRALQGPEVRRLRPSH